MKKLGLMVALLGVLIVSLSGCLPQSAPPEGAQQGFDWTILIFLAIIIFVFYFLMIRPQRKRQKQQDILLQGLRRGDRVVTAGGIYGEIESIEDNTIVMKIESGATMRISKGSVLGKRE